MLSHSAEGSTSIGATSLSHSKQPSTSSVSSNTSQKSKTAAFFSQPSEQVVQPALSVSQSRRSQDNDTLSPLYRHPSRSSAEMSPTSSSGLERNFSWGSGSARRWNDFEGKPITPLPSPYHLDESTEDNLFELSHSKPSRDASTRREEDQQTMATSLSLPALTTSNVTSQAFSDSPKTFNFFGAGSPTSNAPSDSNVHEQTNRVPGALDRSFRYPSSGMHLQAPSRFPSDATQTQALRPSLRVESSTISEGRSFHSDQERIGMQSLHVSPPSPDPAEQQEDTLGSAVGVKKASRHVHGPSENVTNSSILPPVAADNESTISPPSFSLTLDNVSRQSNHVEEMEDETKGTIGPYQSQRVLGVGAFSKVILARRKSQPTQKNLVALKMLERQPCSQNERMRVSWVREVEVLKVRDEKLLFIGERLTNPLCSTSSIRILSASCRLFRQMNTMCWF